MPLLNAFLHGVLAVLKHATPIVLWDHPSLYMGK